MKIKTFIIIGSIFLVIGACLCIFIGLSDNFNSDLVIEETKYTKKEYIIDNDVDSFKINFDASDIEVIYDTNLESSKIVYYESSKVKYNFSKELSYLSINQKYTPTLAKTTVKKFSIILNKNYHSLEIELDAGNLDVNNLSFEKSVLDIDAGIIKIENSMINYLYVELDAGKFISDNLIIKGGKIDINAGDIEFNGIINERIELNVDLGNITLNLNQKEENIRINGNGTGFTDIIYDIDMGKFNIYYLE